MIEQSAINNLALQRQAGNVKLCFTFFVVLFSNGPLDLTAEESRQELKLILCAVFLLLPLKLSTLCRQLKASPGRRPEDALGFRYGSFRFKKASASRIATGYSTAATGQTIQVRPQALVRKLQAR